MRPRRKLMLPGDSSGQSEAKPLLTTVLIPLGLILVAVPGLWAQNVPWWVTAIVVFYIVVVALVVLIPALIHEYRALRARQQRRAAARRYAVLVRQFLTTLSPSLVEDRTDTVFRVWKSAVSFDQGKGQVKPDSVHLVTLGSWLSSIDSRLDDSGRKNFDEVCNELGMVVLQHNRLCEQARREIETLINSGGQLAEQNLRNIKQDWNKAIFEHNQTIKAWGDLAKNINREGAAKITFENIGGVNSFV